jgi:actin related protein 2/3 complex subunit 5
MDTAFRKIDIDQYDEDVLLDSELYEADSRDPTEVLDDAKQRQIAVRSFLARYEILFFFLLFPPFFLSSLLVFSYQ